MTELFSSKRGQADADGTMDLRDRLNSSRSDIAHDYRPSLANVEKSRARSACQHGERPMTCSSPNGGIDAAFL